MRLTTEASNFTYTYRWKNGPRSSLSYKVNLFVMHYLQHLGVTTMIDLHLYSAYIESIDSLYVCSDWNWFGGYEDYSEWSVYGKDYEWNSRERDSYVPFKNVPINHREESDYSDDED